MSTLREIIEQATALPIGYVPRSRQEAVQCDKAGHARQALSARLNPQTALLVLTALEGIQNASSTSTLSNAITDCEIALSALNGTPPTA